MGVVGEAVRGGDVLSLNLDEAGDEGGEDGDDEANAHAVEEGDAAVEAGEAADDGDEETVVEGDCGEHGDDGEDGHGGGGDLEGVAEMAVHGFRLLQREGALLSVGGDEEDSGGPDGSHSDYGFELFDSVNCV